MYLNKLIPFAFLAFSSSSFAVPLLPPPLPPLPPFPVVAPSLSAVASMPLTLDASFPHGLPLIEFARVVLQDVLKSNFIFSDDFLNSTARVGFSTNQLKKHGTETLLREVLKDRGFTLENRSGYYRIKKLFENPELDYEDFIYRPRYRDIPYLSSVVRPLFKAGHFSFERVTAGPVRSGNTSTSVTSIGSPSSLSNPIDNGTSAYSQQTQSDTDVFIFRGNPSDIKRLQSLLASVDIPIPMVLVRALVLEVGRGNVQASAIQSVTSVLNSRLGLSIGLGTAGSNSLSFKSESFNAVLSALTTDNTFKLVSSPSVLVETGSSASLSVGDSVPTLGAIQTGQNGVQQQSVNYVETGTILKLTARVMEDSVSMNLTQEISNAVNTSTGVTGTATLAKRSLSTKLSMTSGEWVVLGGLSSQKNSKTGNKLPFFNIPLGLSSDDSETELVVLVNIQR